jgi:hypothetical protein
MFQNQHVYSMGVVRIEWSTFEVDVAHIKRLLQKFSIFYSSEKQFRELIILSLIWDICSFIISK